jgi:hypothetical protein
MEGAVNASVDNRVVRCLHGLYRTAAEIAPNPGSHVARFTFTAYADNGDVEQFADVVVSVAPLTFVAAIPSTSTSSPGQQESIWSGYVWPGSSPTTAVESTWKVPTINCSLPAGSLSIWIGVDGAPGTAGASEVFQAGSVSTCDSGQQDSGLWWEWYPNDPEEVPIIPANAGDIIHAEIWKTAANSWYWDVNDETSEDNEEASSPVPYNGPGSTAEWIVEDNSGDTGPGTLPEFAPVKFTGMELAPGPWYSRESDTFEIVQAGQLLSLPTAAPSNDSMTVTYARG